MGSYAWLIQPHRLSKHHVAQSWFTSHSPSLSPYSALRCSRSRREIRLLPSTNVAIKVELKLLDYNGRMGIWRCSKKKHKLHTVGGFIREFQPSLRMMAFSLLKESGWVITTNQTCKWRCPWIKVTGGYFDLTGISSKYDDHRTVYPTLIHTICLPPPWAEQMQ